MQLSLREVSWHVWPLHDLDDSLHQCINEHIFIEVVQLQEVLLVMERDCHALIYSSHLD